MNFIDKDEAEYDHGRENLSNYGADASSVYQSAISGVRPPDTRHRFVDDELTPPV